MSETTFAPPYRALWEITWRCDLRCGHCLVDGGTPKLRELDTRECLGVVAQLADLGVRAVSLTGGEPFLRSDWFEIAQSIRSRGMKLRLASNGHLLNERRLSRLVELETESFSVSVDGLRDVHDKMRKGPASARDRSSFDLVVKALRMLAKTSINPGVITTVVQENVDQLPQIHAILKDCGVKRWSIQLGHRTGRLSGLTTISSYRPITPDQVVKVADFIVENSADRVLQPRAFKSIGYMSRKEPILRKSGRTARNPIWDGCKCGITVLGIEPDGGIKGCANQVGAPFIVGNIRDEALAQIWNDRPRWHWLAPSPEEMTGACRQCALAKICKGGCTTLAYRSTGELFNNPYCLRKLENTSEVSAQ